MLEKILFLYIILNGAQNFKFIGSIYTTHDWLNFIHFSGYKYKIRLVSIKGQREGQALISISTILKFSALDTHFKILKKKKLLFHEKISNSFFFFVQGGCGIIAGWGEKYERSDNFLEQEFCSTVPNTFFPGRAKPCEKSWSLENKTVEHNQCILKKPLLLDFETPCQVFH